MTRTATTAPAAAVADGGAEPAGAAALPAASALLLLLLTPLTVTPASAASEGRCASCATRLAKVLLAADATAARAAAPEAKSAEALTASTPEAGARRRVPLPAVLPAALKSTAPLPVSAASKMVTLTRPTATGPPGEASQAASAPATAAEMAVRTLALAMAVAGCTPDSVKKRATDTLPCVAEGVNEGVRDEEGEAELVPVGVDVTLEVGVALSDAVLVGEGVTLELGVAVLESDGVVEGDRDGVADGVTVLEKDGEAEAVRDKEMVGVAVSLTLGEPVKLNVEVLVGDGVADEPTVAESDTVGVGVDVGDCGGDTVKAGEPAAAETDADGVSDSAGETVTAPLAAGDGDDVGEVTAAMGEEEGEAELSAALKLKKFGSTAVGAHAVGQAELPDVMSSAFVAVSRAIHMHFGNSSSETPSKVTWYTCAAALISVTLWAQCSKKMEFVKV